MDEVVHFDKINYAGRNSRLPHQLLKWIDHEQ